MCPELPGFFLVLFAETGGDCLVFGGKARGIVHGVRRIVDGRCPEFLSDVISRDHRLNLNFRQFAWTPEHVRASSSVDEQS